MAIKRMTLEQADAARRRAVTMLENFGDDAGAAEFDAMSSEEYAAHKGIEIIHANPSQLTRGHKSRSYSTKRRKQDMGTKSARVVELEDTIRDIYDNYQNSGTTRAELEAALEQNLTLCTEAVPELDEDDESESEESNDEDE
jgi:hypothetical protein